MTASLQHPSDKLPRIIAVDVLRGFALFGILYAHYILWYAGGPLMPDAYKPSGVADGVAMASLVLLFMGKFFSLFSFLFGLSFHIQIQSLIKRHESVFKRFGWRLCILGLIGTLHHIVWRADILSIYVPLGFLLIFMRNLSNKTLLVIGVLCVLNIPGKIAELISMIATGSQELIHANNPDENIEYTRIISEGSFKEMLQHNINALDDKFAYQINSGRLLITFGFFLLGMLVGRLKWFEMLEQQQLRLKTMLKKTGWIIAGSLLAGIVAFAGFKLSGIDMEKAPIVPWVGGLIFEVFNASITLVYILVISLLMLIPKWQSRLAPLAHVGKMALSCYLMQTAIGIILFFNIGFGLFMQTSQALNAILGLLVFGFQILFCRWWLQHFHYGPVEWLWRSATDLRWKPLIKSHSAAN